MIWSSISLTFSMHHYTSSGETAISTFLPILAHDYRCLSGKSKSKSCVIVIMPGRFFWQLPQPFLSCLRLPARLQRPSTATGSSEAGWRACPFLMPRCNHSKSGHKLKSNTLAFKNQCKKVCVFKKTQSKF